jgi:hypothetical protein
LPTKILYGYLPFPLLKLQFQVLRNLNIQHFIQNIQPLNNVFSQLYVAHIFMAHFSKINFHSYYDPTMDGKIEQRVCIKFCVKLGKSATETLEMLREAFGEHSLSRTTVFEWHSPFKAVECHLKMNI